MAVLFEDTGEARGGSSQDHGGRAHFWAGVPRETAPRDSEKGAPEAPQLGLAQGRCQRRARSCSYAAACMAGWLHTRRVCNRLAAGSWLAGCMCMPAAACRPAPLAQQCEPACALLAAMHQECTQPLGAHTLGASWCTHSWCTHLVLPGLETLSASPLSASDRKQEASAVRRPLCMMRTSEPLMKHYSRNRRIANIGELR